MSHPGMPAIIPPVPEHVRPTEPDEFEQRHGILYCIRCGRTLWTEKYGDSENTRPCEVVKIGFRAGR